MSWREVDEGLSRIAEGIQRGPFRPDWASLTGYEVPQWYLDAKFGIFIHWGPSSVPGYLSDWYAREMYRPGSAVYDYHRATYGDQAEFGFKDFIGDFTMEHFDPMEWAALFRRAGAQFVVPIAEYHDGFAEYDSSYTPYNSTAMGPHRDLLGELGTAVRRRGMTFGASSHYAENWWFYAGGITFDSDVRDPALSDLYGPAQPEASGPNDDFMTTWLLRTCDFVDKYRPQLVWFDGWIEQRAFQPYIKRFAAYYYNRGVEWGKPVAINFKHDAMPPEAAVLDIERGQFSTTRWPFWQTDTSISRNSWMYARNADYKPADVLIGDLADIVSKNGAMLLNIGPAPDGTIVAAERERLLAIGQFLAVNGEALYNTRPWTTYGEGPSEIEEGFFTDTFRPSYTPQDIRFTVRAATDRHGDLLYATALAWPEAGPLLIRTLGAHSPLYGDIADVQLLGYRAPITWRRTAAGLEVDVPVDRPSPHALSLRITPTARRTARRHMTPTHEEGPAY
jgi:alpha-L-fucosidase